MTQIQIIPQTALKLAQFFIDCSANGLFFCLFLNVLYIWQFHPLHFGFLPYCISMSEKKNLNSSLLYCQINYHFQLIRTVNGTIHFPYWAHLQCIYLTFKSCWIKAHHIHLQQILFHLPALMPCYDYRNCRSSVFFCFFFIEIENKKTFAISHPRKQVSVDWLMFLYCDTLSGRQQLSRNITTKMKNQSRLQAEKWQMPDLFVRVSDVTTVDSFKSYIK